MNSVGAFFESALKARPLPEGRVRQLCVRAREGSVSAREQLLCAHLRLVVHVAGYFYRPGCFCELGDLVQQGCLGLLHAIDKFDPFRQSRGKTVRFATYAHYWISHCIRREIENNGRTISMPILKLRTMKHEDFCSTVPLDSEWLEDDHGTAQARLVDVNDTSDTWCRAWEARREVEHLIKTLPPKKQQVLEYRYGLAGEREPLTQSQTGQKLGVSGALIGTLERAALGFLREYARLQVLLP